MGAFSASLSSSLLRFAANGIVMLGELTLEQMNEVLFNEVVGRIGCHGEGRTYVVPITYVFDGDAVYGHSADGLKIRMMRANPRVCFQVDQRENLANWRSVVAQGIYEELHGQGSARRTPSLRDPDDAVRDQRDAQPVRESLARSTQARNRRSQDGHLPHSSHREDRRVREAMTA